MMLVCTTVLSVPTPIHSYHFRRLALSYPEQVQLRTDSRSRLSSVLADVVVVVVNVFVRGVVTSHIIVQLSLSTTKSNSQCWLP